MRRSRTVDAGRCQDVASTASLRIATRLPIPLSRPHARRMAKAQSYLIFMAVRLLEPLAQVDRCYLPPLRSDRLALPQAAHGRDFRANEPPERNRMVRSPKMRQFNRKHDTIHWYSVEDLDVQRWPCASGIMGRQRLTSEGLRGSGFVEGRTRQRKVPAWWANSGAAKEPICRLSDAKAASLLDRIGPASSNARHDPRSADAPRRLVAADRLAGMGGRRPVDTLAIKLVDERIAEASALGWSYSAHGSA